MRNFKVCNDFVKGTCKQGVNCKFVHENLKSKVCGAFRKNRCDYGVNCKFSHDLSDLPNENEIGKSALELRLDFIDVNGYGWNDMKVVTVYKGNKDMETLNADNLAIFVTAIMYFNEKHTDLLVRGIDDCLNHINSVLDRSVSASAGINSFQTTVIPLLGLFCSRNFESSVLLGKKNIVFGLLEKLADRFDKEYYECMAISVRDGLKDYWLSNRKFNACNTPMVLSELFYPIFKILAKIEENCINVRLLDSDKWNAITQKYIKLYRDAESENKFDLREHKICDQIEILVKRKENQGSRFSKPKEATRSRSTTIQVVPPGGRHDNDNTDFTVIKILPTNEELLCKTAPYLPRNTADGNIASLPPMTQLLDTHFRLMRWDVVYLLKDAHESILTNSVDIAAIPKSAYRKYNEISLFFYTNAMIVNPCVTKNGLSFKIGFDQIESKKKLLKDLYERKFHNGQCYFLLVNGRIIITVVSQSDQNELTSKKPTVVLTPIEEKDKLELQEIWSTSSSRMVLIELPNVSLVGYVSVLQALQELEFSENAILNHISYECDPDVLSRVPEYAENPNFRFDLGHLVPGLELDLTRLNYAIESLHAHTTLDRTQCEAFVAGLTRKLSLIKGPPGTGKSFTGIKVIDTVLKNKAVIGVEPVVVIAYTNHALDNFLLGILEANPDAKLVRIGGRSKIEEIQGLELNKLLRESGKNPFIGKLYKELKNKQEEYLNCLDKSTNASKFALFKKFLDILNINFPFDNEQEFDGWLEFEPMEDEIIERDAFYANNEDFESFFSEFDSVPSEYFKDELYTLSLPLRDAMFEEITTAMKAQNKEEMDQLTTLMVALYNQINDENAAAKIRFLTEHQFDVIGLTTTGLSGNISLIKALNPKIVFCEEAAECLEGHILAALQNSVQQLILIGDDQQLTPKINNHDLSKHHPTKQHRLDLSMFERLGSLGVDMLTLNVQRRMRTEIAKLTRDVYYPELLDAPECATRADMLGFTKNVIFLNHSHPESSEKNQTSHINKKEAEMTLEIVNYLINQEYKPEDITVLTPYLGQMMQLRQIFQNKFIVVIEEKDLAELEDAHLIDVVSQLDNVVNVASADHTIERKSMRCIRISTVDNFQGEESKIIVISTVRNVPSKTAGFLTIDNRINVMQSRARDGMIILGSKELLIHGKNANPKWEKIINIISDIGRVSDDLELKCQVHGTLTYVSNKEDFQARVPEGGCLLDCGFKMRCGHACPLQCHPKDRAHLSIKCLKDCMITLKCGHKCSKYCHEDCGKCTTIIKDCKLPCDHTIKQIKCSDATDPNYKCKTRIKVKLACGHKSSKNCHMNIESVKCKEPCNKALDCGHICRGLFHDCEANGHLKCVQSCKELLNCSHYCASPCHAKEVPHGLCSEPCFANCNHSTCSKKCADWCNVCIEPCLDNCEHQAACALPCGAPCTTLPCNRRCSKLLDCDHQCPTVCGEVCPSSDFCQECGKEEILSRQADDIMMTTLKEINLNEDPIVIFPCSHFRTIASADGLLELSNYFDLTTGQAKPINDRIPFPKCPECRGLVINIPRYSRIWKKAMIDHCSLKFKARQQEKVSKLQTIILNGINAKLNKNKKETPMSKAKNYYASNINNIDARIAEIEREDPHLRILNVSGQDNEATEYLAVRDQKSLNALMELKMAVVSNVFEYLSLHLTLNEDEKTLEFIADVKLEGIDFYQVCQASARKALLIFKEFDIDICYAQMLIRHLELESKVSPDFEEGMKFVKGELNEIGTKFKGKLVEFPEKAEFVQEKISLLNECGEAIKTIEQGNKAVLKSVIMAMERENGRPLIFHRCPLGHLYTIGECGMAMETSRCPECGKTIGGTDHEAAAGNTQVGQSDQVLENQ